MKKYKAGTKFEVCTLENLIDVLGWWEMRTRYYHDDFGDLSISLNMMGNYAGETLTIINEHAGWSNWYTVEENKYVWPVATFLSDLSRTTSHTCEEGMTPIDSWFICKICGTNLREIK